MVLVGVLGILLTIAHSSRAKMHAGFAALDREKVEALDGYVKLDEHKAKEMRDKGWLRVRVLTSIVFGLVVLLGVAIAFLPSSFA